MRELLNKSLYIYIATLCGFQEWALLFFVWMCDVLLFHVSLLHAVKVMQPLHTSMGGRFEHRFGHVQFCGCFANFG